MYFCDICLKSNDFIQENAHENVVCEMTAILARPQWVNPGYGTWENEP